MKIITRKYRVYSFKELKEEARQKAIEEFSDINVNHDWWEDDYLLESCLPEKIKQELKLLMFETGKRENRMFNWDRIYFDLDRGRYLQFEGLRVLIHEPFCKMLRIPKRYWNEIEIRFTNERDCFTQLEWFSTDGNYLSERFDKVTERADEIFQELMEIAWKNLRDNYEDLTSEEAIVDSIEANSYQFLKNGSLFY